MKKQVRKLQLKKQTVQLLSNGLGKKIKGGAGTLSAYCSENCSEDCSLNCTYVTICDWCRIPPDGNAVG
jgi:hypothetical protein